jgi:hypothetical protein
LFEELFADPSIVANAETENSEEFMFSRKYIYTEGVIEGA